MQQILILCRIKVIFYSLQLEGFSSQMSPNVATMNTWRDSACVYPNYIHDLLESFDFPVHVQTYYSVNVFNWMFYLDVIQVSQLLYLAGGPLGF